MQQTNSISRVSSTTLSSNHNPLVTLDHQKIGHCFIDAKDKSISPDVWVLRRNLFNVLQKQKYSSAFGFQVNLEESDKEQKWVDVTKAVKKLEALKWDTILAQHPPTVPIQQLKGKLVLIYGEKGRLEKDVHLVVDYICGQAFLLSLKTFSVFNWKCETAVDFSALMQNVMERTESNDPFKSSIFDDFWSKLAGTSIGSILRKKILTKQTSDEQMALTNLLRIAMRYGISPDDFDDAVNKAYNGMPSNVKALLPQDPVMALHLAITEGYYDEKNFKKYQGTVAGKSLDDTIWMAGIMSATKCKPTQIQQTVNKILQSAPKDKLEAAKGSCDLETAYNLADAYASNWATGTRQETQEKEWQETLTNIANTIQSVQQDDPSNREDTFRGEPLPSNIIPDRTPLPSNILPEDEMVLMKFLDYMNNSSTIMSWKVGMSYTVNPSKATSRPKVSDVGFYRGVVVYPKSALDNAKLMEYAKPTIEKIEEYAIREIAQSTTSADKYARYLNYKDFDDIRKQLPVGENPYQELVSHTAYYYKQETPVERHSDMSVHPIYAVLRTHGIPEEEFEDVIARMARTAPPGYTGDPRDIAYAAKDFYFMDKDFETSRSIAQTFMPQEDTVGVVKESKEIPLPEISSEFFYCSPVDKYCAPGTVWQDVYKCYSDQRTDEVVQVTKPKAVDCALYDGIIVYPPSASRIPVLQQRMKDMGKKAQNALHETYSAMDNGLVQYCRIMGYSDIYTALCVTDGVHIRGEKERLKHLINNTSKLLAHPDCKLEV